MNGRMYDPVIGRVLSPDTYVQAPGYTQSYNRYSYCMNNPLRYTDPSGWQMAALGDYWNLGAENDCYISFSGRHSGDNGGGGGWGGNGGVVPGGMLDSWATTRRNTPTMDNLIGSLWNATSSDGYETYSNVSGDWYNTCTSTIAYINASAGFAQDAKNGMATDACMGGFNEINQGPINNFKGVKGLTLNSYYAFSPDDTRTGYVEKGGGVVFDISYTSKDINSSARWVQVIFTNDPTCGRTSPYFDNMFSSDCSFSGSMYYCGPQYTSDNTSGMFDNPVRPSSDGNVNWKGVAMLWQEGRSLVTIIYGFSTYNCQTSSYPIFIIQ